MMRNYLEKRAKKAHLLLICNFVVRKLSIKV